MRRSLLCGLALLISLAVVGCGKNEKHAFNNVGNSIAPGDESSMAAARPDRARDKSVAALSRPTVDETSSPPLEPAMASALVAMDERPARAPATPQTGLLTAGSIDDLAHPGLFQTFARRFAQQWGQVNRFLGKPLVIHVRDQAGNPVGNARVTVSAAGSSPVQVKSRSDGRAVFLSSWDNYAESGKVLVTVSAAGASRGVKEEIQASAGRWEITLPGVQATTPRRLDLALVIDTTGSMGDELEFIKNELRGIAAEVRRRFPDVEQRYALIVYRDRGDQYVTKSFDFTSDLESFQRQLAKQSASGGGDRPEAMHAALAQANRLSWRDDNTARVVFLAADAPPHGQFIGNTFLAVNDLRKKGLALYPIACSDYDPGAELVLRASALLTGSRFLFLTDDSGVGNGHAEPHFPFYHVERLDGLMIRMIASELAGKHLPPARDEILRSVGKPTN